jgi:putative spermidine/putrescine transport system permease protein
MKNRFLTTLFLTLALLPLAAGLSYALAYSLGLAGALQTGFTTQHWQAVLGSSSVWVSLGLSMLVALVVVAISVILALATVLFFKEELRASPLRFGIYWPLAVPPIVAAFWGFQLLGNSGLLARVAAAVGLIQGPEGFVPLINDPWQVGIVAVLTMATFPFFTVLLFQFYHSEQLPRLLEVARSLGASSRQAVLRIALPVLLQRLRPLMVLYGVFLFGAYEVPLLLGSQSQRMISMLIAQKFRRFDLLELPQAYVITVLYTVVVLSMLIGFRPGRQTNGRAA